MFDWLTSEKVTVFGLTVFLLALFVVVYVLSNVYGLPTT